MPDPTSIPLSQLTITDLSPVGSGGQADALLHVRLPNGETSLLFKRYLVDEIQPQTAARLRDLVRWRHQLSPGERVFLDARASWVRLAVHHDRDPDAIAGVLIPVAPNSFWDFDDPEGRTPRDLGRLYSSHSWAYNNESEYFNLPDKLARLGHLIETLAFLHAAGMVVGDLSPHNALVSGVTDKPATYLLDCDSVLYRGVSAMAAVDPELMRPDPLPAEWPVGTFTVGTDLSKLGLIVARSLRESARANDLRPQDDVLLPQPQKLLFHDLIWMVRRSVDATNLREVGFAWQKFSDGAGNYSMRTEQMLFGPWTGSASFRRGQGAPPPAQAAPGRHHQKTSAPAAPTSTAGTTASPGSSTSSATGRHTAPRGSGAAVRGSTGATGAGGARRPPPPSAQTPRSPTGAGPAGATSPKKTGGSRGYKLLLLAVLGSLAIGAALDAQDGDADVRRLDASAQAQAPATADDSVDGQGNTTTYAAANMLDDDTATAWRMPGDGTGAVLQFQLDSAAHISELGLINGYAKQDPETGVDRYAQERRITRVTWTVAGQDFTQDLADATPTMQAISFAPIESSTVSLRIDVTGPPGDGNFDYTAISDVYIAGT